MSRPLPTNQDLEAYSASISWKDIEMQKRRFNETLIQLRSTITDKNILPLDELSEAAGVPIRLLYDTSEKGNVLLAEANGRTFVLGSVVSERYRGDKTLLQALVPYNFNPSVNHTNLAETDDSQTKMRALGAELELGLFHRDGSPPSEEEMQTYMEIYRRNAHKLGITPTVDREACQYQVEVHVAPGVGYLRTRKSIDGIMRSLVVASNSTGLQTAILAAYPILSDFSLTPDPKVRTAVDVMAEVNNEFSEYLGRQAEAKARYQMAQEANVVQVFRLQGCHIHLDIAGRSEALALLTFYTMLRSATAIANSAVLKGAPFVNGTCDAELLCTREYLRSTTVTGRYLDLPLSPHFMPDGLEKYGYLLRSERANSVVRGLLYEDGLGSPISAMHNPIGRVRPDLSINKRICTIESTGMPVNISASRQAAVLTDFEFTLALIEHYFRKHGWDLGPMQEDETLWDLVGPLGTANYQEQQDQSDRVGIDMVLKTPSGKSMTLPEFYEMKRIYMHKHLYDAIPVSPRDIDDVYTSMGRMLQPPSGRKAETVEQYICDPMLRSTGNWGQILLNSFMEEGGVPGTHNPDAILRVANRIHDALTQRYLSSSDELE